MFDYRGRFDVLLVFLVPVPFIGDRKSKPFMSECMMSFNDGYQSRWQFPKHVFVAVKEIMCLCDLKEIMCLWCVIGERHKTTPSSFYRKKKSTGWNTFFGSYHLRFVLNRRFSKTLYTEVQKDTDVLSLTFLYNVSNSQRLSVSPFGRVFCI